MEQFEASLTEDGRYHLLVDSITDYAIYMLDPTGHVTSWNAGARRFKGYKKSEIIGKHFSVFYTDEDRCSRIGRSETQPGMANSKTKAGGFAKTAGGSGLTSSSTRFAIGQAD
jgi:PAS domain S-box-containing protein